MCIEYVTVVPVCQFLLLLPFGIWTDVVPRPLQRALTASVLCGSGGPRVSAAPVMVHGGRRRSGPWSDSDARASIFDESWFVRPTLQYRRLARRELSL